MHVWNVRHTARWKCWTQKSCKKSPSGHYRTTLSGYIFATKARIDSRETACWAAVCPPNVPTMWCGELRPTNSWDRWGVWGTPVNFNVFRVLAALLHGSQVLSVSQTRRRWTEGATYVRQGDHHVGHWPTFLVMFRCCTVCPRFSVRYFI